MYTCEPKLEAYKNFERDIKKILYSRKMYVSMLKQKVIKIERKEKRI